MHLRCLTVEDPKGWSKKLPWTEYWYNTSFQTSIGTKQFKAVYGETLSIFLKYLGDATEPLHCKKCCYIMIKHCYVLSLIDESTKSSEDCRSLPLYSKDPPSFLCFFIETV
ncbi:hypothetical protein V8G54_000756 [Vigna mungo]|uniref:Uncharacterized protein n=1 Tax=Vigna mungo TaxID=3915 RepID=A0AAQ3P7G9_VIGMU